MQVTGEQPIFTGFRNYNAIRQARSRVQAGAAQLTLVEQDVLQRGAQAYFDVVRDMEVYQATANNVQVLLRQQEEASLRFEVGEVTRTDVAQADARLAQSRAQLTTAQARLAVSRATFAQIFGMSPATLEENPELPPTPATLDEAMQVAAELSPVIIRAKMTEQASRRGVAIAKGAFSPTVSLTASYQYADEPSSFVLDDEQFAYGARASIPIFLGGLNISRVREAKALNEADRRRVDEADRQARAQVTSAWEQLSAARANINSATSQVAANELALTGVRRENQLGVRTTLDVLDAEQEYLNAQVSLANAERDARSATFTLLAAMGVLTLGEDVGGDLNGVETLN
ncbi:MAG: TolC family outer membrane protein [Parvularculaceae bacterium]|nr:TolC family outer membrane protein [Parvularculaceae bacterium]